MATEDRPLIWVTGANGFLGQYVTRAFERDGWRVVGTQRPKDTLEESEAEKFLPVSLDAPGFKKLLDRTGPPSAVFHAAGSGTVGETISNPRQGFSDTVGTAFEMVQFLVAASPEAVLIYPSSCSVYGDYGPGPISEDAPRRPVSPYAAYKGMVEMLCHSAAVASGLRVGVIRYFSVYGPGQRKQLLWDLCRQSAQPMRTIRLAGTGDETRDFLHAEDAASLSVRVAHHLVNLQCGAEPLTVNGGTGRAVTIRQVVQSVRNRLGDDSEAVFNTVPRPGDPQHLQASLGKSSLLGFTPHWRFEDGVADYCRWFTASHAEALDTAKRH